MKTKTANIKKKNRANSGLIKKILRTVPENEAFYFFTGIGEYTGEYATNLDNFCNKIKLLESRSVFFHSNRHDFEKWIKETIGDAVLANKINEIKKSIKREAMKAELYKIVKQRISQLKKQLASEEAPVKHF